VSKHHDKHKKSDEEMRKLFIAFAEDLIETGHELLKWLERDRKRS
jgi:hypothetical protein